MLAAQAELNTGDGQTMFAAISPEGSFVSLLVNDDSFSDLLHPHLPLANRGTQSVRGRTQGLVTHWLNA